MGVVAGAMVVSFWQTAIGAQNQVVEFGTIQRLREDLNVGLRDPQRGAFGLFKDR